MEQLAPLSPAERLEREAKTGGITVETAEAIDRLARAPLTISWRRLGRLLVLEKWAVMGGSALIALILIVGSTAFMAFTNERTALP